MVLFIRIRTLHCIQSKYYFLVYVVKGGLLFLMVCMPLDMVKGDWIPVLLTRSRVNTVKGFTGY